MADHRNWLIDHTGVGVADIHKSARFYEAALRPLGIQVMIRITRGFKLINDEGPELGGVGYGVDYPMFGSMSSILMALSSIRPSEL